VGGIPPAEPSQFRSNIFKQTPQIIISTMSEQIKICLIQGNNPCCFIISPKNGMDCCARTGLAKIPFTKSLSFV
jgi:hypothetical protein